ncbi:MAG: ChaN family lipoprotein [Bacteroidales bacterium]|nr:ChaN family lipoprotein [Bacteroidales bacterium]
MLKQVILLFLFELLSFHLFSQSKSAYIIYDTTGNEITYHQMVQACQQADIVLFGELHNNTICHWLEYELLNDLLKARDKKVVVGAEMFEADNQLVINELFQHLIPMSKWEENVRLWPNYSTDYKPIVDLCYQNGISLIATNIPRRYAAKVARGGFESLDSLSDEAKKYIAPLPIKYDENLGCYKNMMSMGGMGKMHANPNLPKAQAIKDATMAHFILKYLPNKWLFYHFNGAYHSDNFEGIVWYLKQKRSDLKIVTISSIEADDISKPAKEELSGKANFIIAIPSSMTKTY